MNDFNKHVKSDTIKWIVVFTLLIVLMSSRCSSSLWQGWSRPYFLPCPKVSL